MGELHKDFCLEFERPVRELENQINELKQASDRPGIDLQSEIKALQEKVGQLTREIYENLSPWERVQLSRHPLRPHAIDYINQLVSDFHEIHGDRRFADDPAMICGLGKLNGQAVAVVGIEKGRSSKEKILRNFGMPRPEGYRKAMRLMDLADRFGIPLITFIDTPGAYPGIGAEERGQSLAIAENLLRMFELKCPTIAVVIGEGGSGGALGIGICDQVFMLKYSVYSVISPESCASILWSNPSMAETAANALQIGPEKAKELGVIDSIIDEPAGGAHRDPQSAITGVGKVLSKSLKELLKKDIDILMEERSVKFRKMGNQTLVIPEES